MECKTYTMTILTFTPRTTTEAARIQKELSNTDFDGSWNQNLKLFDFVINNDREQELLEKLISGRYYGYFQLETL